MKIKVEHCKQSPDVLRLRREIWALRAMLLIVIAMATGGWFRMNQWVNDSIKWQNRYTQLLIQQNENRPDSPAMLRTR